MKIASVILVALCVSISVAQRKVDKAYGDGLPRFQGASLLVGTPPFYLMVAAEPESIRLQPEYEQPETRDGTAVYPSISLDGKIIAYARVKVGMPQRITAVSTYSASANKHATYAEGEYSGSVAISSDGSKLAYSAARQRLEGPGDDHLHILDLRTGHETLGPPVAPHWPVFVSWSPDARRLAYGVSGEVRVWDAETGKIAKIADGDVPAWSPSGEWIAYLQGTWDSAVNRVVFRPGEWAPRCLIVRPDGTAEKTIVDFSHKRKGPRFFAEPPVWSPDSKTILLNEAADVDTGTVDIHLIDVSSMKVRTPFKNSLRVLGWAEGK